MSPQEIEQMKEEYAELKLRLGALEEKFDEHQKENKSRTYTVQSQLKKSIEEMARDLNNFKDISNSELEKLVDVAEHAKTTATDLAKLSHVLQGFIKFTLKRFGMIYAHLEKITDLLSQLPNELDTLEARIEDLEKKIK